MGLCLRMTRRRDVAEDCVQQTFIRAWRNLAAFEGRSAFGTWLHRIAVNEVLTPWPQSRHARRNPTTMRVENAHRRAGRRRQGARRRRSDGRGARAGDVAARARVTSSCCRLCTATATKKSPTCSASRSARARRNCIAAEACCASAWAWRRRRTMSDESRPTIRWTSRWLRCREDVPPERDLWPQAFEPRSPRRRSSPTARRSCTSPRRAGFRSPRRCCSCSPLPSPRSVITRQSMQQDAAVQIADSSPCRRPRAELRCR